MHRMINILWIIFLPFLLVSQESSSKKLFVSGNFNIFDKRINMKKTSFFSNGEKYISSNLYDFEKNNLYNLGFGYTFSTATISVYYYPDYSLKYKVKRLNSAPFKSLNTTFLKGNIITLQIQKNIYNINRFDFNLGFGVNISNNHIYRKLQYEIYDSVLDEWFETEEKIHKSNSKTTFSYNLFLESNIDLFKNTLISFGMHYTIFGKEKYLSEERQITNNILFLKTEETISLSGFYIGIGLKHFIL